MKLCLKGVMGLANKKIWLASPTMHGEELDFVREAYETNWMSTVGANINEIEKIVCEKVGCKYAVALSCGVYGSLGSEKPRVDVKGSLESVFVKDLYQLGVLLHCVVVAEGDCFGKAAGISHLNCRHIFFLLPFLFVLYHGLPPMSIQRLEFPGKFFKNQQGVNLTFLRLYSIII